ncbi:hypothetical protein HPB48_010008 [Haemaphysalis longicornis]|uniref:Peptidase aspartic putative domain-containing protein n=1 Tax=Haemaphysalis longicornis TaxID=44386 RepID=A0A9J6GAY8_HAELO|nr:hypothetical protein HPB48_010008 [Haemaphysalis longicornis]
MCDPEFLRKMHAHGEETKVKEVFNAPISLHASENTTDRPSVLMPTVTAWSSGQSTKSITRILFDSGSQRSFITEELSQRLGCRPLRTEKLSRLECLEGRATHEHSGWLRFASSAGIMQTRNG